MKTSNYLILIIMSIMIIGCSGGGGGSSVVSASSPPLKQLSLYIDAAASLPLPNGSAVHSGVYVNNDTDKEVSGIQYQVVRTNSATNIINSIRRLLPVTLAQKLGLTNDTSSNETGFILDADSVAFCSDIKAHSSCLLQFTTPSLASGTMGNAIIKMNHADSELTEIINYYDYGDPSVYSGVNFSNFTPNTNINRSITVYLIGNGTAGTINKNIQLVVAPTNTIDIMQGINSSTEIASGQVIAIQIMPTLNSNVAQAVAITPFAEVVSTSKITKLTDASGNSGTPSLLMILPSTIAILSVSNVPYLSLNNTSTNPVTITLVNNGLVPLNALVITLPAVLSKGTTNCTSTLASTTNCTLQIYRNTTAAISGDISYTYTGGSLNSAILGVGSTVVPNISITSSITGNLSLKAGDVRKIIFTIKNLTSESLTSVTYASNNKGITTLGSLDSSNCGGIIGSAVSCQVIGTITASGVAESSGLFLTVSGMGSNGTNTGTTNYIFQSVILYTVSLNSPVFNFSPPVSIYSMSIIGDNADTATQTISLLNTGAVTVNTGTITINNQQSAISGDAVFTNDGKCDNKTLVGNSLGLCSFTITLNKVQLAGSLNESGLAVITIPFTSGTVSGSLISNIKWAIMVQTKLIISSVSIESSGTPTPTGDGTSANPYVISGSYTKTPSLTITYKNVALNYGESSLVLDVSQVSPYWNIDSNSSCGYGAIPKDLKANASCTLILNLNRFYANNSSSVTLDVNYPGASWQGVTEFNDKYVTNQATGSVLFGVLSKVFYQYQNATVTSGGSFGASPNNNIYSISQTVSNINGYISIPVTIMMPNIPINLLPTNCNVTDSINNTVTCNYNSGTSSSMVKYDFAGFGVIVPMVFDTLSGTVSPAYLNTVFLSPKFLMINH